MLNKETLMLVESKPIMGWIATIELVGWGWGASTAGQQLTAFGGAPRLNYILSVGDTLVTDPTLPNGSKLRRSDTGQTFTVGEKFVLFTEADQGKTITVYYIPA